MHIKNGYNCSDFLRYSLFLSSSLSVPLHEILSILSEIKIICNVDQFYLFYFSDKIVSHRILTLRHSRFHNNSKHSRCLSVAGELPDHVSKNNECIHKKKMICKNITEIQHSHMQMARILSLCFFLLSLILYECMCAGHTCICKLVD